MSEEVKKVKEKYEQQLLKIKGVTGIGFNHSINIYVEKLTPQLAAFLPKELNGIKVRVIETGKIVPLNLLAQPIPVAHAIYSDRTGRFRPAPGGVSMGSIHITAGTLSCRAIDKRTVETLGLSNNHVAGPIWGEDRIAEPGVTPELQPGSYDGGVQDGFGILERIIPVELEPAENLIDAAVFKSDQLSKEIHEIGEIESPITAKVGMNLVKSGRTTGVTYSSVFDVNATVKVSGAGDCIFKDQIIAKPAFLSPGDSGSWCGHIDSLRTVGLGFAGSPEVSIINKAPHVENLLNIFILPPSPEPMSSALLLGIYGAILGTVSVGVSLRKREKT